MSLIENINLNVWLKFDKAMHIWKHHLIGSSTKQYRVLHSQQCSDRDYDQSVAKKIRLSTKDGHMKKTIINFYLGFILNIFYLFFFLRVRVKVCHLIRHGALFVFVFIPR